MHYYLDQILNDYEIRKKLTKIYNICLDADMDSRLIPFYLLYHAWGDLEYNGENYYFEGADLSNIEGVLKEQAQIWIDKYVHGIEVEEKVEEPKEEVVVNKISEPKLELVKRESFWDFLRNIWKRK